MKFECNALGMLLASATSPACWPPAWCRWWFYASICWAVPVLAFGTAAAMVLMAVF